MIGAELPHRPVGVLERSASLDPRSLAPDVHDVGDYERPLEPGMVLTVEPGIYVAKEGIGVRMEDDVLVTASGIEVLSAKIKHK